MVLVFLFLVVFRLLFWGKNINRVNAELVDTVLNLCTLKCVLCLYSCKYSEKYKRYLKMIIKKYIDLVELLMSLWSWM